MALESGATYINNLNVAWPDGAVDSKSDGDNHIRLLKSTIKNTFPNVTGAMNATHTNLNSLVGVSASVTSTQLNFLTGLTTNVQTALDGKANLAGSIFTGAVHARTATGDSPLITSHNQSFGGVGLFSSGVDGGALLIQTTTAGAYEKRIMTATRNGGQVFYYNDAPLVDFGFFGVTVTGSVAASFALTAGQYLTVGTTATVGGNVTSTSGNITASAGNVSDSRGQLKGYRTSVKQTFTGTGTVFSGIPTDAEMIELLFVNASFTSNSEVPAIQLSSATNYNGKTSGTDSGGTPFGYLWNTYGRAPLTSAWGATHKLGGLIQLRKMDANTWMLTANVGPTDPTINSSTSVAVGAIIVSSAPTSITFTSTFGGGVYDDGFATMYVYR